MCNLSSENRSDSGSETQRENRDSSESFTGKNYYNQLIAKANSVPIINILRYYNVQVNEFNTKTTCPFPSHKGGKERTPSFLYYSGTNSFYCFGCAKGGGPCFFVSSIENISKVKSAQKIIELFAHSIGEIDSEDPNDYNDKIKLMLSFSDKVRDFRFKHLDKDSFTFIEGICQLYDDTHNKYKIDNEALKSIINDLIEEINLYECK